MKKPIILISSCLLLGSCMNVNSGKSSISSGDVSSKESSSSSASVSSSEKKPTINDCNGTEQIEEYKSDGYSAVFGDSNWKKGFRVTKTFYGSGESPYHDNEKIDFYNLYDNSNIYDWTLAQWSSKYDLMDDDGKTISSDETGLIHTITSKGKTVDGTFVPAKKVTFNSLTGELELTANASVEYETPRPSNEKWVHLLLEQGAYKNNGELVNVSKSSSIMMEARYTVTKCEDHMDGKANPSMHAAQLVWYVTLQNLNKNSKGYGKYIWFGLNLYDNRYEGKSTTLYSQYDKGTGTGIYSPASSYYLSSIDGLMPSVGQETVAKIDVLSLAQLAYNEGKSKGYFDDTAYEDLYLGGGNFGYELPGTYDISTNFEAINVFVK